VSDESGTGQRERTGNPVAPLTPNASLRYDVISRLLPPNIQDVLEVGCGQGAAGLRLARRYSYVGVEPDHASWSVARRRFAALGSGEVHNTTIGGLDENLRFDVVCAFEVLEHIEDDAAALAEWRQRLRPDGWLLLSVPAHQTRYGPADELVGHFRRYDAEDLTGLLVRCGFDEISVRHYGFPLGYLLESGRNRIAARRLRSTGDASVAERTAGSGRLLQPSGRLRGAATHGATLPFQLLQRAFPNLGTGLVVRARRTAEPGQLT
jgi:SAM-dependent methyltransferase